jgi:hypothetical protein
MARSTKTCCSTTVTSLEARQALLFLKKKQQKDFRFFGYWRKKF